MENSMIVCSSPHIRDNTTTRKIMRDVIIALLPATIAGVYFFGLRALGVVLVTILSCMLSEYVARRGMKRENTLGDLSAVVTGLLLGLNLPPTMPLWIAAIGGVIAIVIVKQLFGGIGQNFMNPALAARVILLISWPVAMTNWVNPGPDAVSGATPLALLKGGEALGELPSYMDLFIGNVGGCIGETSAAAILIGALYLLAKRIISIEIPLTFIATVAFFTWVFGGSYLFEGDAIFHLLAGGLMIGAFFMATDYATSPVTTKGRIIMGFGCGVLTFVIRLYTGYPEGVSFAIILMNIVVPLIDRYTIPKSFGGEKSRG